MKKLFFLALIALVSCDSASKIQDPDKQKVLRINGAIECFPVLYSDKVYYFPCTGGTFGRTLAIFLEETTKEISSTVANGTGSYGEDYGYWVTLE